MTPTAVPPLAALCGRLQNGNPMHTTHARQRKTIFYLMRHAPTEWNHAGRIQGQADSPLTEKGQRWATGWGAQLADLALQQVLSSDTGRALATAQYVNRTLNLPLRSDARLREQDWGDWTGCSMADIRTRHRARFRQEEARGWAFCPPGGESHLDVLSRARQALLKASRKWPRQRLLVITHEGLMKGLVYHLAILQGCGRAVERMAPYCLHRLALWGDNLILEHMNAVVLEPRPEVKGVRFK
jgi:broad specificity phosphatase PhoE